MARRSSRSTAPRPCSRSRTSRACGSSATSTRTTSPTCTRATAPKCVSTPTRTCRSPGRSGTSHACSIRRRARRRCASSSTTRRASCARGCSPRPASSRRSSPRTSWRRPPRCSASRIGAGSSVPRGRAASGARRSRRAGCCPTARRRSSPASRRATRSPSTRWRSSARHPAAEAMIRRVVDWALHHGVLVLLVGVLLLGWGVVAFHRLPIEAYPDVADTWVQVITQWPGHAAQEVEQQVTVPIETQVNGIAHVTHLRSVSLFGLSVVTLIFDDQAGDQPSRQQVLERLAQVTLPAGVTPQLGPDYSPVGQIYFYTLASTNPAYDLMELKALQDWVLEKQFKSVPGVVDVVSFGGLTREYQVQLDPNKLVSYGLTIGEVEQALAANNVNAGGSFIEHGSQAFNVRAVGLMADTDDIGTTVLKSVGGTAVRVRDVATVVQGPKIRLGKVGKAVRHADGTVVDEDDVVQGYLLLRKGAPADDTLRAVHAKVEELNQRILPRGVRIVPFLDRSDLVRYTTHTVLHNLAEGMLLVTGVLFFFLGNVRSALIVAATIPFALLFASILLDATHVPANLLSLGALDFGMLVDGSVVMVENVLRHVSARARRPRPLLETIAAAAHEVQRPVFYAIVIIITAYLPIFTLQRVEGRLFRPMAWTVAFALLGALLAGLAARYRRGLAWCLAHRGVTFLAAGGILALTLFLGFGGVIGSEFLPHLDEGAIWVRGTLAASTGPSEGARIAREARLALAAFPEVTQVVSQVGRPDDGTDATGFFNTEYFVDLLPRAGWRRRFRTKDDLIAAM